MYLWNREMQSYRGQLQGISAPRRLALAVSVMDGTLDEMGQMQAGVVKEYIDEGMQVAHEAVRSESR